MASVFCQLRTCENVLKLDSFRSDCALDAITDKINQDEFVLNSIRCKQGSGFCLAKRSAALEECQNDFPLVEGRPRSCYTQNKANYEHLILAPASEWKTCEDSRNSTLPSPVTSGSTSSTSSTSSSTTPKILQSSSTLAPPGVSSNTTIAIPTSTASTQTPEPQKSGMSEGAVAGIAIGTAVLGAAIAGLIFLFLLQKYRKRNQQAEFSDHPRSNGDTASDGKTPVVVGNAAVAAIDSFLPQPAEDDAISGEMSRLRDNIKNHVQSYYITSAVNPNSVDQAKLLDLSAATGVSPAKLQDMFLNPLSRTSAIRLYLAWVILSRCGTQKATGPSFLPGEVAAFASLLSDSRSNANLVLATKWKAISGELLQSKYGRQQNLNSASLGDSVSQAMASADAVLFPFVNASLEASSDKRLRNLEVILKRAAQFAFLLFSQPSIFVFEWAAQKGGVVVFPGLLQIVDEEGNVTQPPKVFSSSEVGGAQG